MESGGDASNHIVAESGLPIQCNAMSKMAILDVPANRDLRLIVEIRALPTKESQVLFHGRSETFSISAGQRETLSDPIQFVPAPTLSKMELKSALGPPDCNNCYISSATTTVTFEHLRGTTLEIANDADFSACYTELDLAKAEDNQLTCSTSGECSIFGWDLSCGLEAASDGPRSVYARVVDAHGYLSSTLSTQVVLDTTPPAGGTVYSTDGGWTETLQGKLVFAVQDAEEMFVEACRGQCTEPDESVPDGLVSCSSSTPLAMAVNTWIPYRTQGCVRLSHDQVEAVRVKYRDIAGNETPWFIFPFEQISLEIEEAVGPSGCAACYVSQATVSFQVPSLGAGSMEVANDSSFAKCLTEVPLVAGNPTPDLTIEETSPGIWRLQGWDLNCGLDYLEDGQRSVFVRLRNTQGHIFRTLAGQVMLDTHAPHDGTLFSQDGTWLIDLDANLIFGVLGADEMWVEACSGDCLAPDDSEPENLTGCKSNQGNTIKPNHWQPIATSGCVRIVDDGTKSIRVKYRDWARNESDWSPLFFENVVDLQLDWVSIPAGTFDMGCSVGDTECEGFELPLHNVEIGAFQMTRYEITEQEYEAALGFNPAKHCPTCPVRWVDWFSAGEFCQLVGGRLPSEGEWEYAARAGTSTKYTCGNNLGCLTNIAWHQGNASDVQPVGSLQPNDFGLHDMLGNVWEWNQDWFSSDYYCEGDSANVGLDGPWTTCPPDATSPASVCQDPQGPPVGTSRVLRGGGANEHNHILRVSRRTGNSASFGNYNTGFRCVRDLDE